MQQEIVIEVEGMDGTVRRIRLASRHSHPVVLSDWRAICCDKAGVLPRPATRNPQGISRFVCLQWFCTIFFPTPDCGNPLLTHMWQTRADGSPLRCCLSSKGARHCADYALRGGMRPAGCSILPFHEISSCWDFALFDTVFGGDLADGILLRLSAARLAMLSCVSRLLRRVGTCWIRLYAVCEENNTYMHT